MKLCILTLVFTLFSVTAFSNELCERGGISSLSLVKESEKQGEDSCSKAIGQITDTERIIIEEISRINLEVAHFFQLKVVDLFSNPLKIEIKEHIFGPYSSFASNSYLVLGAYPGDDFKVNNGVYLHELGHILLNSKNPLLPAYFTDIHESHLLTETFSDLLALSIHGNIVTPRKSTPDCLDRLRYITNFQTYDYPMEYFQNFSEARIIKCCASLMRTKQDEITTNMCETSNEWFSEVISEFTPFDPSLEIEVDNHQIGIPVASFLKSFAKITGRSLKVLFKETFIYGNQSIKESFTCRTLGDNQEQHSEIIHIRTARNVLNDLHSSLPASEAEIFSKLYEKHKIEKGLVYSDRSYIRQAESMVCSSSKCEAKCELLLP